MIEIDIPGKGKLSIEHAVFDVNGTIAEDGIISEEVKRLLKELSSHVVIHLVTADTYGTIRSQVEGLGVEIQIVRPPLEGEQKADFVFRLGRTVAAFGNGANDLDMLKNATLSVAVIGKEGCYAPLIAEADMVVYSPLAAAELILNPKRITATLRR